MIDLHLHTTASDGRSTPEGLVAEAAAAGCRTIAVTDHDTTAAVARVAAAARDAGLAFVPGIEMTAVDRAKDIHILGYGIDTTDADLAAFLAEQRVLRRARVVAIAERLSAVGAPIDVDALLASAASTGRALGRPAIAAALIAAGHVPTVNDAFDRYLAEGRPGFVVRDGAAPAVIVDRILRAGGVVSIAHPGKYGRDDLIAPLVDAGMGAIEVFHPDHDRADVERYQAMAASFGLVMTGGSDYHGPGTGRASALGRIGPPAEQLDALLALAAARGRA
jgi:predicted metal-dependent phosphoesterase TrpH